MCWCYLDPRTIQEALFAGREVNRRKDTRPGQCKVEGRNVGDRVVDDRNVFRDRSPSPALITTRMVPCEFKTFF